MASYTSQDEKEAISTNQDASQDSTPKDYYFLLNPTRTVATLMSDDGRPQSLNFDSSFTKYLNNESAALLPGKRLHASTNSPLLNNLTSNSLNVTSMSNSKSKSCQSKLESSLKNLTTLAANSNAFSLEETTANMLALKIVEYQQRMAASEQQQFSSSNSGTNSKTKYIVTQCSGILFMLLVCIALILYGIVSTKDLRQAMIDLLRNTTQLHL